MISYNTLREWNCYYYARDNLATGFLCIYFANIVSEGLSRTGIQYQLSQTCTNLFIYENDSRIICPVYIVLTTHRHVEDFQISIWGAGYSHLLLLYCKRMPTWKKKVNRFHILYFLFINMYSGRQLYNEKAKKRHTLVRLNASNYILAKKKFSWNITLRYFIKPKRLFLVLLYFWCKCNEFYLI